MDLFRVYPHSSSNRIFEAIVMATIYWFVLCYIESRLLRLVELIHYELNAIHRLSRPQLAQVVIPSPNSYLGWPSTIV